MIDLTAMGAAAKAAARTLGTTGTAAKNAALCEIAAALRENSEKILEANRQDIATAREMNLREAMIDRLTLSPQRINDMADAVLQVAAFTDPVGTLLGGFTTPAGMSIKKVAVPLGVIGIIFESRPNVTVDAAVLCLKAGNATILRGGKEAFCSNNALCEIMRAAVSRAGLPADSIQLVQDITRESASALMQLVGYLDVLIPRGGAGLIRAVVENSKVPVIETGSGNCHIYVDSSADIDMAAAIVNNAKTSRVSVCNAAETLLVHRDIAPRALPAIKQLLDRSGVELRCDDTARQLLGEGVVAATEQDYATEFLDYILAVRVVDSIDEAIEHIAKYSTGHSEAIVTNDYSAAQKFTAQVDSAAVYVNCSTRFTDGGEFGYGAEIGISTQKLHARGPMGLQQLTSVKYIINGDGQIR